MASDPNIDEDYGGRAVPKPRVRQNWQDWLALTLVFQFVPVLVAMPAPNPMPDSSVWIMAGTVGVSALGAMDLARRGSDGLFRATGIGVLIVIVFVVLVAGVSLVGDLFS